MNIYKCMQISTHPTFHSCWFWRLFRCLSCFLLFLFLFAVLFIPRFKNLLTFSRRAAKTGRWPVSSFKPFRKIRSSNWIFSTGFGAKIDKPLKQVTRPPRFKGQFLPLPDWQHPDTRRSREASPLGPPCNFCKARAEQSVYQWSERWDFASCVMSPKYGPQKSTEDASC